MAKITTTYREQEPLIINQTKDTRTQKTKASGLLDILNKWLVVRYKSGGQLVVYAQSTAGLNSALSDATANSDLVKFYGTFSGAVTIPAGVELCGDGVIISELSGTVTNNGILSHCYVSGTLSNNGRLNNVVDDQTYTQMTGRLGVGISPRALLHSDSGGHTTNRVSSPSGYDSSIQLYTRSGADYDGPVILKDRDSDGLEIHYDDSEGVSVRTDLLITAATGQWYIGSDGTMGTAVSTRKMLIDNKAASTANDWGMNTSSVGGSTRLQIVDADSEDGNDQPLVWLERQHDGAWPGTGDPSTPVNIYAEHTQTGSDTAFTHTIMALAINESTGDNDVIGVSGRARKTGAGAGDAAGVWGSAYNSVNQNGGVMGVEGHIYQNAAGMVAGDSVTAKWSAALHARSDSTGSDAFAGLQITGNNTYRFWNGIIIDSTAFRSGAPTGTVGLNMAGANPEYGIKFGSATRHIYGTGDISIEAVGGNTIINGASAKFDFAGTSGGGNEAITYKDSGGTQRNALQFPGSDVVAILNRAASGVVQLRANSSTAGAGGETIQAIVTHQLMQFNGGNRRKLVTKTAAYTIALDDWTVLGDTTSGNFTFTLPTAASAFDTTYDAGNVFNLVNIGSGTLTIDGNGSETINGDLTWALSEHEVINVQSDGTEWWIVQ